jgi:branched-chain amino acid transport system substrate-binding protein
MQRFLLAACTLVLGFAAAIAPLVVDAKETVKIVFIGPLTGGNAALGLGGRNSADLAVQLHNADAKAKYTFDMVKLDDLCKPDIGVQVATKAGADNSIIAGVTHYCSAVAIATVDTYHKFGLPVIVWGAVLPAITYGNDYPEIHRVNGTMINQNEQNAKLVTSLGYKTWVIIHDTTDYGKGHDEYFTKYLTQDGGKVLADFGVGADQQDFTAILTKVKELNPDVVYFGGLTPIGVRLRSQMDKLGIKSQFEGTSGIVSDSYIQALGPIAEGTIAFIDGAPIEKLPGGKFFLEQYAAHKYAEPPEAYGAYAFVAANLIMDAIEKVGPNRKAVTAELAKTKDHESIVGPVTFDAHGQNVVPIVTAYVVQDGKWVVWSDSDYAKGKRKLAGQK